MGIPRGGVLRREPHKGSPVPWGVGSEGLYSPFSLLSAVRTGACQFGRGVGGFTANFITSPAVFAAVRGFFYNWARALRRSGACSAILQHPRPRLEVRVIQ